ncbi:MAG TPA: alpha/beta fold hydrolase [Myxococcales bacterium]|nr:alpha/beta fold hydrolase [Myxococcales bacterium]
MTVVLLHGFTGSSHSFDHLGLSGARTPIIPGHGKAPKATSWETTLDRLEASLTVKSVLCGYSMGARLALALAFRHPDRIERLVLVSGTAGIEDPQERVDRIEADEELAQTIEQDGVPAFIQKWEQHPSLTSLKPFAAQLRPERLANSAEGLASALRELGTGAQPSYWSELSKLNVPVLLLAGVNDAKFMELSRRMHKAFSRSELRELSGCGHAPHLERPEAFLEALK